jgi:hypothetical protein
MGGFQSCVTTCQEDHPGQTESDNFLEDLIREKEIAKLIVQSAEEPEANSDSKDEENREETEVIAPMLGMSKPYRIHCLDCLI